MKICIAEKPSVAREIAKVIGADQRKDGYFEGNGYQVTYTFGHLCSLLEPHDYKAHWKGWNLNNLPMLPEKFAVKVVDNSGIQKQFSTIKNLLKKASEVINCGDAGQEGELIQRWVLDKAGYRGPVKRLWISSLTEEAIRGGFDNLQPSSDFDNLYFAGYSRAIGDWLLGMNASRLYTLKYAGDKQVLSVGRVQTPTLAMIVERYRQIMDFKPEPYWVLQTLYKNTVFDCEEGRFSDQAKGEGISASIEDEDLEIISVEKKKGNEYAPKLFDLTGLQVYCNAKFSYTADQTLKIVQSLYEKKLVTYPRVDTTYLPTDLYPKIPGILRGLNKYQELTQSILGKKIKKSSRVFQDKKVTDHHAIIPTGQEQPLVKEHQNVYDAITRRFIAVFYADCKVANTVVKAMVKEIPFRASGKLILEPGWRVVFEDRGAKDENQVILPKFSEGEKGPHQPSLLEKTTKAPSYYTEASLLRAMETAGKQIDDDQMRELLKENGIGRPSTRASIIETLFRRNYIKRVKKQIHPTSIGVQLIDLIGNDMLKSAELTGKWEKNLREIENGDFKAGHFVNNMKRMVDRLVYEVRTDQSGKRIQAGMAEKKPDSRKTAKTPVGMACPKCKEGTLLRGKQAYGCNRFKKGCDFVLPFSFMDKKISDNQLLGLLKKGKTRALKGFKQEGRSVSGHLYLDESLCVSFSEKEDAASKKKQEQALQVPEVCPKCGKGKVLKGRSAYGCSRYREGCDYRLPFS